LLKQISDGPGSDASFFRRDPRGALQPDQTQPSDFRAYQQLGRFGNALVLDELEHRPTRSLTKFVENFNLHGYDIPKD